MENWKDVKGYEGLYKVSDNGNVWRIHKNNYMKIRFNHEGYQIAQLWKGGKGKGKMVHRLVAEAFIPNPENKPYINHIDGDKTNNDLSNLEWCTQSENVRHALKIGLAIPLKGEQIYSSILKEKEVNEIYELAHKSPLTQTEIGKAYGIGRQAVGKIKNKKRWKHILN